MTLSISLTTFEKDSTQYPPTAQGISNMAVYHDIL